jgi:hypothetical protein
LEASDQKSSKDSVVLTESSFHFLFKLKNQKEHHLDSSPVLQNIQLED